MVTMWVTFNASQSGVCIGRVTKQDGKEKRSDDGRSTRDSARDQALSDRRKSCMAKVSRGRSLGHGNRSTTRAEPRLYVGMS